MAPPPRSNPTAGAAVCPGGAAVPDAAAVPPHSPEGWGCPDTSEALLSYPDAGAHLHRLLGPASPPRPAAATSSSSSSSSRGAPAAAAAAPNGGPPPQTPQRCCTPRSLPPRCSAAAAPAGPRASRPAPPPSPGKLRDLRMQADALRVSLSSKEEVLQSARATLAIHGGATEELARLVREQRAAVAALRSEMLQFQRASPRRRSQQPPAADAVAAARAAREEAERAAAEHESARAAAELRLSELREEGAVAREQRGAANQTRRAELLGHYEDRIAQARQAMTTRLESTCAQIEEQVQREISRLRGRADFLQRQVERKQEEIDELATSFKAARDEIAAFRQAEQPSLSGSARRQQRGGPRRLAGAGARPHAAAAAGEPLLPAAECAELRQHLRSSLQRPQQQRQGGYSSRRRRRRLPSPPPPPPQQRAPPSPSGSGSSVSLSTSAGASTRGF
eukprot:TRINITY_DN8722_c4_g2_i3.p1 TRINITY_DN8722_c4_g2~~TRINITY_DN8722_c4_g2_i3.p1  ORF type:complete len:451 (+),score=104.37 TRINITY_DN8722_c4_g2_i3:73-1425(+)